ILSNSIPVEILDIMLDEYVLVKHQFLLRKYQPAELNAARFCECVLRIIEYINSNNLTYTSFGKQIDTNAIIRNVENNTSLKDTLRFLIPRLVRVILDVRNKRDVAHVGGEVNPNYSDSLLVVHATDWILTEIVRHFHNCSIEEAQRIVQSINEAKIPIVADVNGFIRVQNTSLDARRKTLVILYYKRPSSVSDADLCKWARYGNPSRFKIEILKSLDSDAFIHYENRMCVLLDKGLIYVENNIPLNLIM
ncbi:MAG TPA: hypothetical protein VFS21_25835, partial [Roseiflexaceae bacterium]|nr:hypothetical protein [Roseiflexaceae bacterium]